MRVSEYLFEFADDPRTANRGRVTVRHAHNLFPDPRPEKWEQAAMFEAGTKPDGSRVVALRSVAAPGRPRPNLPRILLRTDRPYLSLDKPNAGVTEYRRQK